MQAVILAAGKGTRMGNLTTDTPKPLLQINGKSLLECKLELLPEIIDEIVLVIGYRGDIIKNYFGNSYKNKKITYVVQPELLGTGHALWQCREILKERFMVMMGDDIYDKKSMEEVIRYPFAMTIKESPSFKGAGNVKINDQGNLEDIIFDREGIMTEVSMDICLYSLTPEIFNYSLVKVQGKNEYGLPHTLASITKNIDIKVLKTNFWLKINTSEDLVKAQNIYYEPTALTL